MYWDAGCTPYEILQYVNPNGEYGFEVTLDQVHEIISIDPMSYRFIHFENTKSLETQLDEANRHYKNACGVAAMSMWRKRIKELTERIEELG